MPADNNRGEEVAIPCTECGTCTSGCPHSIAIPQYFSLYNEDMRLGHAAKDPAGNFARYEELTREYGKASNCIGCNQCEWACPEQLPIISYLKDVAAYYE